MFEAEMGGSKARLEAKRLDARKRREEAKKKRLEREAYVKKCEDEKQMAEEAALKERDGKLPQLSSPKPHADVSTPAMIETQPPPTLLLPQPPPPTTVASPSSTPTRNAPNNLTSKDRMMQQAAALRLQVRVCVRRAGGAHRTALLIENLLRLTPLSPPRFCQFRCFCVFAVFLPRSARQKQVDEPRRPRPAEGLQVVHTRQTRQVRDKRHPLCREAQRVVLRPL